MNSVMSRIDEYEPPQRAVVKVIANDNDNNNDNDNDNDNDNEK